MQYLQDSVALAYSLPVLELTSLNSILLAVQNRTGNCYLSYRFNPEKETTLLCITRIEFCYCIATQ
jgi:hypothetical protein